MAGDATIQDLHRKIQREREIINAAQHMLQASGNTTVAAGIDSQIREGRRNIQYFEQTLRDLQSRTQNGGARNSSNGGPAPPPQFNSQPGSSSRPADGLYQDRGGYGFGGHDEVSGEMPASGPYSPAPPGAQGRSNRARPNYSRLGAET